MDLVRDLEEMADEGSFYVEFGSYALSDSALAILRLKHQWYPTETNPDDPSTEGLSKILKEQADAGGNSDPKSRRGESNIAEIMRQLDELGFTMIP